MDVLLDTNVLLRIVDKSSSQHLAAAEAVRIISERSRIVIVPQIAHEFWAVATRSAESNGLGMNVSQADQHLMDIVDEFPLLRDERGILQHWWELVRKHSVAGVRSYDARIVAAMMRTALRSCSRLMHATSRFSPTFRS